MSFILRERIRVVTFIEDMFRKRGWKLAASISDMAEVYAKLMMIRCAKNEGSMKIGTTVKFIGDAPDNGATYEQPVLNYIQVTWDTPESDSPSKVEEIWNYFQFVIDATPRHKIRDGEVMGKYFQFLINGAPKNNKGITHGEVVCNYFQCALDELTGRRERFRSLADSVCVQWYDKDWKPICIGLHEPANLAEVKDGGSEGPASFRQFVARLKEKDAESDERRRKQQEARTRRMAVAR